MKQSLQLRIGQKLAMTPQLQQAIRLLHLSSLELQAEIQQNLESNPLLELDEDSDEFAPSISEPPTSGAMNEDVTGLGIALNENRAKQTLPEELDIDVRWEHIYEGFTASSAQDFDPRELFENQAGEVDSLKEHLILQLDCAHLSELDHQIGTAIIDAVDDNGYLSEFIEDIHIGLTAGFPDLEIDEVEVVLRLVQRFDPVGVAARSVAECITIQLQQCKPDTPHLTKALELVNNHLEHLERNDLALLKRRLQVTDHELASIVRLIRTVNPHPGQRISGNRAEYIIPDVYVVRRGNQWGVSINPEHAPRLRVNNQYASLIKRNDNSRDNHYLKDQLQEANWFMKSLQSRNQTLLQVAETIVNRQHAFLEYGEQAMQPMILRDIAELLDKHESTISRVTTNKYMHTPRGIFEFKFFFSSHVSTASGGECSATAIQALIKKLVAAEKSAKPLSDSKIADLLQDQGINVARRTVAKYRKAMQMLPSNQRRRLL